MIWKKFERLTVISEASPYIQVWWKTPWRKRLKFTCMCECWNYITTTWECLRSSHTRSCWCLQKEKAAISWRLPQSRRRKRDIVWEKYWRLTVLSKAWYWWKRKACLCKCECWNKCIKNYWNMKIWRVKSCWCLRKEIHTWVTKERLYSVRSWMKERCSCKTATWYNRYWGRWIKIEWETYNDFKRDMWESHDKHLKEYWRFDTTIERTDTNWNYCKENCTRATRAEQNRNRNPMWTFTNK